MDYSTDSSNVQRISDVIGDDYKEWKDHTKIFISAPTGSGKTYFVLNVLLPYVAGKKQKMVYFVNRRILQEQLQKEIADLPFDQRAAITIETYQSLECDIKANKYIDAVYTYPQTEPDPNEFYEIYPEGRIFYHPLNTEYNPTEERYFPTEEDPEAHKQRDNHSGKTNNSWYTLNKFYYPYGAKKYDYAVCDECHYFLTDSNYNTNTAFSFSFIMDYFNEKTTIFMSATIADIKRYIEEYCDDRKFDSTAIYHFPSHTINRIKYCSKSDFKTYEIKRNYDYVDVHIIDREKESIVDCITRDSNAKWMIFVDSVAYGRELEKTIKDELSKDKSAKTDVMFLSADYRNEAESRSNVEEITSDKKFNQKILIATSVMDNGITIKDIELRNVILIADNETEFVQMLGRKRQDGNKVQLYIVKQNAGYFKNILIKNREIRSLIARYMDALITYVKDPVSESTNAAVYNETERAVVSKYQKMLLPALMDRSASSESLRRTLYADNGFILLNMLSVQNLENMSRYYQDVISSFEREGENAFVKRQLSWLGKSEADSDEAIAELSYTVQEKVINEFAKVDGQAMNKEQNMNFKSAIVKDLLYLIKEYEPKNVDEEKEKQKVMDALGKNDRVLTEPNVKFLNEHCGIPYEMDVDKGIYTLKKL